VRAARTLQCVPPVGGDLNETYVSFLPTGNLPEGIATQGLANHEPGRHPERNRMKTEGLTLIRFLNQGRRILCPGVS
jgi:hypothetical protein